MWSVVLAVSGNAWTVTGALFLAGWQFQLRGTELFAADLMSFTRRGEVSTNGNTWTPYYEEKYTKVQPAPKK